MTTSDGTVEITLLDVSRGDYPGEYVTSKLLLSGYIFLNGIFRNGTLGYIFICLRRDIQNKRRGDLYVNKTRDHLGSPASLSSDWYTMQAHKISVCSTVLIDTSNSLLLNSK